MRIEVVPYDYTSGPNQSQGRSAIRQSVRIVMRRVDKNQVHGTLVGRKIEFQGIPEKLFDPRFHRGAAKLGADLCPGPRKLRFRQVQGEHFGSFTSLISQETRRASFESTDLKNSARAERLYGEPDENLFVETDMPDLLVETFGCNGDRPHLLSGKKFWDGRHRHSFESFASLIRQ